MDKLTIKNSNSKNILCGVGSLTVGINSLDFVSLVLKDTQKYLARTSSIKNKLASFNDQLGFEALNINLVGTDESANSVLDEILNRIVSHKT